MSRIISIVPTVGAAFDIRSEASNLDELLRDIHKAVEEKEGKTSADSFVSNKTFSSLEDETIFATPKTVIPKEDFTLVVTPNKNKAGNLNVEILEVLKEQSELENELNSDDSFDDEYIELPLFQYNKLREINSKMKILLETVYSQQKNLSKEKIEKLTQFEANRMI